MLIAVIIYYVIIIWCFSGSNNQKQPPEVFCKKDVLTNFANFTAKQMCQSLFNKVAGFRPATSLKKRLYNSCFPVNNDDNCLLKWSSLHLCFSYTYFFIRKATSSFIGPFTHFQWRISSSVQLPDIFLRLVFFLTL